MKTILTIIAIGLLAAGPAMAAKAPKVVTARVGDHGLITFPNAAETCGVAKRKHYVTCVSQEAVLDKAIERAKAENKTVLVEVGADWCVWCLSIDRYFNGWVDEAREPAAAGGKAAADELAKYMAANFVIANLNTDAKDINTALGRFGKSKADVDGVPAFFLLKDGKARTIPMVQAELPVKSKLYGYSRKGIIRLLKAGMEA